MQQCISSLALNVEALRKRKVNPRAKKLYLFAAKTHGNQTKKTNPKKRPCDTSILYKRNILPSYSGLLSDINDGRFKQQEQFKTTSVSQSSRFLIINL